MAPTDAHPPVSGNTRVPNALVVFEHRSARGPMRLLRSGFRHCFCVLGRGEGWIVCDPLKGSIVLEPVAGHPVAAFAEHFARSGRRVLCGVAVSRAPERLRIRPVTCVEIVKRLVGVDAPWVFTPYQLFRFLQGEHRAGLRFEAFQRESQESNFGLDSVKE